MMRRLRAVALVVALAACVCAHVSGQRRVTPVTQGSKNIIGKNENKQPGDSIDYSNVVSMTDEAGNTILVDTISGIEVPDTAQTTTGRVPKMINPLLFSASVGVDIWDPLMRAFGQKYGLIGFSAKLNLHNRYIPVVEFGLGNASSTPSDQNFTYHVGVSPWFRIGANYNFLYNSNPDYQFVAGLRLGWSHFQLPVARRTPSTTHTGVRARRSTFPADLQRHLSACGLRTESENPRAGVDGVAGAPAHHPPRNRATSRRAMVYPRLRRPQRHLRRLILRVLHPPPLAQSARTPPGLTDDDLAPGVPPDTPTEELSDGSTPEGIAPEAALPSSSRSNPTPPLHPPTKTQTISPKYENCSLQRPRWLRTQVDHRGIPRIARYRI